MQKKISKRRLKFMKKLYYSIITMFIFVTVHRAYTRYKYYLKDNYSPKINIDVPIKKHYLNETGKSIIKPKLVMKYILLWTNPKSSPFIYFGDGSTVFNKKKCERKNCYVTGDRNYLGDYSEFDVIVFNGPQLSQILDIFDLPRKRFISQKYVYANIESSATYPLCSDSWNHFFNWTWTYRLDSDSIWGYIAVRNATGHVIGPNKEMNWISLSEMEDIDEELKLKLKSKKKLAAWFVSNCNTLSLREEYVKKVQHELRKYNLDVDIFGSCGTHQCPREIMSRCLSLLERDYYFYFSFENAISQDYVTEKILYALNHDTVPVVYGGANYTRFMPDGIYLNAHQMEPRALAKKMYEITINMKSYHMFFRWKKYYSYHYRHESPDTDNYCNFCSIINNDNLMKTTTVYENLNDWWTTKNSCFIKK
ncbi:alpha-(1,3)-fucosyltransferase C [Aphomia sociella]